MMLGFFSKVLMAGMNWKTLYTLGYEINALLQISIPDTNIMHLLHVAYIVKEC
jgi:hypothetical protein